MEEPQPFVNSLAGTDPSGQELEDAPPPTVRRSGRTRKVPATALYAGDGDYVDPISSSPTWKKSTSTTTEPRRNPKRQAAPEVCDVPDHVREAALAPLGEQERSGW